MMVLTGWSRRIQGPCPIYIFCLMYRYYDGPPTRRRLVMRTRVGHSASKPTKWEGTSMNYQLSSNHRLPNRARGLPNKARATACDLGFDAFLKMKEADMTNFSAKI